MRPGRAPAPPDAAGRLLGRLSVLPALLAMAWLLAGLPLLLAGRFTPVLMLVVAVPLAAVLCYLGLRWIPGRWQSALPAQGPRQARTPWWAVAGVIAVAAAFGAHQLIYHSQQIIVQRDPASYIQFAAWIAHHGSLPIPQARAAFGGTHQLLHFDSLAFYQVGDERGAAVHGGPADGRWRPGSGSAGWARRSWCRRCSGPARCSPSAAWPRGSPGRGGRRWRPSSSRSPCPSSSPAGRPTASRWRRSCSSAGCAWSSTRWRQTGRAARVLAALGGLALGLTLVVRIDGASDILPVIPYCGMLLLSRRRQAVPLLGGLLAGALCGAVDGLVLSRPYLDDISSSLNPLVAAVAVIAVM